MKYINRQLEPVLLKAARQFPAVVLTGPRRAGKTEILKHCFPDAAYHLLEDPDLLSRVRSDPRSFLDEQTLPVILDEIQNAPELLSYIRTHIDAAPRKTGRWLLAGSQESALMTGVNESMAGRAAILHLLPLSQTESPKVDLFTGGFPEVIARPSARELWFSSYLQTYLERDVRSITQIRDLGTFRRFMGLLASRHGQVLNKSDLAAPLGISVPTIGQWLGILETTGLIALIPPYFENFGKRLIKSPKLYWLGPGLACHLLAIQTRVELERSPFLGTLWEGYVASEILKNQINRGARKELYYFRDERGLEVDFLVPAGKGRVHLVEAKATRTPAPAMAVPMRSLAAAMKDKIADAYLVHRPAKTPAPTSALAPGVSAVSLPELVEKL
ncbi:putative AAA+ superfamily ATPase [Ereboglobus sp. PH5-10]|uniref:ATP-binding protein n=1 Tax=Ereboglobus sp. PH5-10 TaxID=2940629 RepID=UPI002405B226|nr:ATP-binding protein [Ereboglobus sp. PH5-10]MDF9828175.1 putative AAA+ superfamily ATPase [Ereboglobus sp. PH5-10]